MSVFDENRSRCRYCDGYINHWDWDDNELHDSGNCTFKKEAVNINHSALLEKYDKDGKIIIYPATIKWELAKEPDYLLDLDHTLADI